MSIAANQLRIARELWARLQPLDRHVPARLQSLLADRRFGSRDRRLYRELLFTALRHARALATLDPADEAAWAALLAAHCAPTRETEPFRVAHASSALPLSAPLALVPPWFATEHDPALPVPPEAIAAALLARAPVWVRLQSDDPSEAFGEWSARGWIAEPAPHPALADAFKLPPETNVSACSAYQSGHYEIQDFGSQAILAALDLPNRSPGPLWLDACAGAGGKTLQLARLLGPAARIDAADIRPAALTELRTRAARAGLAERVRTLPGRPDPAARYDGVLVDAPCSGSGTWRRAPHLMACTTEADLAAAARAQTALLAAAAALVRPGGLLVYATCSIARTENRSVAEAFLATHADTFTQEPPAHDFGFPHLPPALTGLAILPGLHDNDGFHMSIFRRTH
jgi:16S rRNA (cytosine967-C5)-methyltransferase